MPPARNEVVSPSEGGDTSGLPNPKYPSTPYWPWSPTIGRGDDVLQRPERFVGQAVVATEKLDGGCTLLHGGRVYARSVSTPSKAKWMAMVKKHHAWKVTEPDLWLYGEDIYGVPLDRLRPRAGRPDLLRLRIAGRHQRVRCLRRPRALREEPADSPSSGPFPRRLPIPRGNPRVPNPRPRQALRTRRRAGRGRAASRPGVPSVGVPEGSVQERSTRACPNRRTLDPEMEALPDRGTDGLSEASSRGRSWNL